MTLKAAAMLFVASWITHTLDHIRQSAEAPVPGTLMGVLAMIFVILPTVALTLIFVDHPKAALVGAVAFPTMAVVVIVAHFLPESTGLSVPVYPDVLSMGAAAFEVIAATVAGLVAFRHLRADEGDAHLRPGLST